MTGTVSEQRVTDLVGSADQTARKQDILTWWSSSDMRAARLTGPAASPISAPSRSRFVEACLMEATMESCSGRGWWQGVVAVAAVWQSSGGVLVVCGGGGGSGGGGLLDGGNERELQPVGVVTEVVGSGVGLRGL